MNKEFIAYLQSLNISGALLTKIEETYIFYKVYLAYDIDDIFVSEYLNEDGSRVYENLWFFNSTQCFESKLFLLQEDHDVEKLRDSVSWFVIKKSEYDIMKGVGTEKSRLFLSVGMHSTRQCIFKASKENCNHLSYIFKKYIKPNYDSKL